MKVSMRFKKLAGLFLILFLAGCLDHKGEKMKETYEIQAIDGTKILFDKETNLMIPNNSAYQKKRSNLEYLKIHSNYLLQANNILTSSPYSSYTPSYLDPNLNSLQGKRDQEYFLNWRELYLKEPAKGSLAPWTKEEKKYYLSLKSKKERYIYLVQRSGLRCAIIDLPKEAIGNAKEFPKITALVESNRNTLKSDLHMGEWGICAGILGDPVGFAEGTAVGSVRSGFKARARQSSFLYFQLTGNLNALYKRYEFGSFNRGGVDERPLKASLTKPWVKNPPVDEFGMIPFLDELIGVDWIMDFNKFPYALDEDGDITDGLYEEIQSGKLLDPREPKSTKESREEFRAKANFFAIRKQNNSSLDFPYDPDWKTPSLVEELSILSAKIMAVTPPQGYINAPYYYFPEELDELYESGKLDRKLDPRIPAIRRVGFPQELVKKIEEFARSKK